MILKSRFGEDIDEWPKDDDPAWIEVAASIENCEKEFTKQWKKTNPTSEKLFFQNSKTQSKDKEVNEEEWKKRLMETVSEVIAYYLTTLSPLDMNVAILASQAPELLKK